MLNRSVKIFTRRLVSYYNRGCIFYHYLSFTPYLNYDVLVVVVVPGGSIE